LQRITFYRLLPKRLRDEVEILLPGEPSFSGTLRAMLFHVVLVVARLHVGALAVAIFWLARKLRIPRDGALHVLTDEKQMEGSCFIPGAEEKPALSGMQAPDEQQDSQQ